jgi:apolipoprotein N-acyltransferase
MNALWERAAQAAPRAAAGVTWPAALAATCAGPLLFAAAFPPLSWGYIGCIALAPLFWLWAKSSWKQAFWWGWLAGVFLFVLLLHWMTESVGQFVGAWAWVALAVLCVVEGFAVAVAAVVTSLAAGGHVGRRALVAAPAAWLLTETARGHGLFSVPFGDLGLAAVSATWFLPLSAYGGVALLTLVFAASNAAVAGILAGSAPARRMSMAVFATIIVLTVMAGSARRAVVLPAPSVRVGVVQGNVSQAEKWSPQVFARTLQIYSRLTRQAAARGARIVVWPETAVPAFPLQDRALLAFLGDLARGLHVWIVAGAVDRAAGGGYYNILLDLAPDGSVAGVYRKHLLVPFAEYLPWPSLRRFAVFNAVSDFLPGPGPATLPAAGKKWGTLICYESAFRWYARQTVNRGADGLIIATDDAWFGGTSGPVQHADIAVIDAVATGRWVARAADTGISAIIDPDGRIVGRLPFDTQGILVADVGEGVVTPYDRLGSSWLLAVAALAVIGALVRRRQPAVGWRSKRGRP